MAHSQLMAHWVMKPAWMGSRKALLASADHGLSDVQLTPAPDS
jgi:hypothetical protein